MRILVTGGAGFIGSNVADLLIESGHEVHVMDNLSTGFRENLNPRATFLEMDIRSPEAAEAVRTGGFDILCHHAAQMDVRRSVREPLFDADVNILGTISLLEAARDGGVKRVVYASTGGAVYGEPSSIPVREDHPVNPICHYGISKHTVEHYLFLYRHLYGLDYVVLRYPNVYGPRQNPHGEAGVTAIFSLAYLENRRPRINGDGEQLRDYVHVRDIARANLLAMDTGNHRISGRIFNIGWGRGRSVKELDSLIRRFVGTDLLPEQGPALPEEILKISLDAGLAAEVLGWKPSISFEDGLSELVEYHRGGIR
ncbi:MAG TPA: NAD-dependent epimerase/dehydratase family protein [Candidatus Fermentibacter daniensis]|nr:NAD-dependent epimerase/dehydratase family protein [Candidatus Fermentibacter daniensis]HOR06719.1 NAD-dependent epimerase/dehydratase family protein [Candidatus Fermentibacter daniensis]HPK50948.1 NAD-dependent epimerase/dehydratase family protein [Candidatus Fermentibacter daniensis]